jgi:hypothetical protein
MAAPVDINALASQSAAQGQQQLNDYIGKATDYRAQYGNYQAQADAANKSVSDYTDYMKNEGSAGNQYNKAFDKQKGELGYDPAQMTAARGNLNQATGALSAYSDFANTSASKWGLNAGGFAAANAGALGGLNNNIASNQGVVNSLSDLYKTAQTGANQFTGQVIQGEQTTMAGLQQVFSNAANQRDSAASMMNFYDDLASKQGGLNASQQQYYAAAKQAYASAQAAMAQAGLYAAQAAQTQQQIKQGSDYMNSPAYKAYLNGSAGATASAASKPSTPTPNGGGGPSIWQDNKDFWTGTAPKAVGHAAQAVGSGALNWGKGLFTGASW